MPKASAPSPEPSAHVAYYIWAGESSPSLYIRTYDPEEATHAFISGPSVYSAFAGKLSAVVGGASGSKAGFGPEGDFSAEFAVGASGPGSIEVLEPGNLILDLRGSSGGIYEAKTRSNLPEYQVEASAVRQATASVDVQVVDIGGDPVVGLGPGNFNVNVNASGQAYYFNSAVASPSAVVATGPGKYRLTALLGLRGTMNASHDVSVTVVNEPANLEVIR